VTVLEVHSQIYWSSFKGQKLKCWRSRYKKG